MNARERARLARDNFLEGYNCPQSVVGAFEDVLAKNGIDVQTALRLSSPFGGGMGRMREVCGAVSGMLMVLGLVEGYNDPAAYDSKKVLYEHAQQLAGEFEKQNGSILCRDLLGLQEGRDVATPERRTQEYYDSRPCAGIVQSAAQILGEYLEKNC